MFVIIDHLLALMTQVANPKELRASLRLTSFALPSRPRWLYLHYGTAYSVFYYRILGISKSHFCFVRLYMPSFSTLS